MQLSLFIATALALVVAPANAQFLRNPEGGVKMSNARRLQLELEENGPGAVIKSPECAPLIEGFSTEMNNMWSVGPKSLKNYICNPIERHDNAKLMVKLEEDVANRRFLEEGTTDGVCKHAMGTLITSNKGHVEKGVKDWTSCHKEVDEEIAAVESKVKRRDLSEGDSEALDLIGNHRELFDFGGLFTSVSDSVTQASTLFSTGWNRFVSFF